MGVLGVRFLFHLLMYVDYKLTWCGKLYKVFIVRLILKVLLLVGKALFLTKGYVYFFNL